MGLYADPTIYDILQTPGTAGEVDDFERVAAAHGVRGSTWFEPACGTGRYLRVLAERGRRVLGYDADAGMVAYAARRLGSTVWKGSMTDAVVPGVRPSSVAVAINPVNTLRLLMSDREMTTHFAQVAGLLAATGIYIVGISLDDPDARPDEDLWEAARGRCRVSQLVNYLPPEPGTRRETVLSHLVVTRPRGVEHHDDRYELRSYSRRQWRRLVQGSALDWAGSYDGSGRPLGDRVVPYQLEGLVRSR